MFQVSSPVWHFSGHQAWLWGLLGGEFGFAPGGAETRDGGNLGTRAGAVISHFQDTYLGRAEIIMAIPAQTWGGPWEHGLLVNTLTSLTALYNLNFPDALHDKKLHIWSRPGKWKRLNWTLLQKILKVLPWSAAPHCISWIRKNVPVIHMWTRARLTLLLKP